ncbi:MAG: DUF2807 domain-containing protein [Patescibacteria group bacterium]
MKKALQITLAGNLFTIEEDGYEKLNQYLSSIKAYFKNIGDSDDVVEDIEARIAEQLLEKIKHHNNIVTLADVTHVMESMGTVEEISGAEGKEDSKTETEEATTSSSTSRRLYRSSDDVVIAGVAAGLAAYTGIDPFAMRIIFAVLLIATSGGFAFVYLALAFLIPEAKTATDKVKMRGGPVTLASFKEDFTDQMQNIKNNGQELFARNSVFRTRLEQVFKFFGSIVRMAIKIAVKLIGIFLIAAPAFISLALIFMAGNLIFNYQSPYIDFPISQVVSQPVYTILIIIGFLLIFIPVLFIGSLGTTIVAGRSKLSGTAAMIWGGIWIIMIILAGTFGVRYSLEIRDKVLALPEYQVTTQTVEVSPFTKIKLEGGNKVTYVEGNTYSVTAKGRLGDIQDGDFKVENDTLTVQEHQRKSMCIVCFAKGGMDIIVTAPNLQAIQLEGGVNFEAKHVKATDLTLSVSQAAFANVTVETNNLIVDLQDGASLITYGTTTNLKADIQDGAEYDAGSMNTTNATIMATDAADVHVHATGKLEITAADGSDVTFEGTTATIHTEDGAQVNDVSTSTKKAVDLTHRGY